VHGSCSAGTPHCRQAARRTRAHRCAVAGLLRHREVAERTSRPDDLATVGVLLTPDYSGRPWDTTMARIQDPGDLTPEQVIAFDQLWNSNLTPN
jgi:hypothetical protein